MFIGHSQLSPGSAHERSAKASVATNKRVRARKEAKEVDSKAITAPRGMALLKFAFFTNGPLAFLVVLSSFGCTMTFFLGHRN